MTIDLTTLEHLADLSALDLDDDESSRLLKELQSILGYVQRVQSVDCSDDRHLVESCYRRTDHVVRTDTEPLFAIAPELNDDLFCTPVVTESLDEANIRDSGESG